MFVCPFVWLPKLGTFFWFLVQRGDSWTHGPNDGFSLYHVLLKFQLYKLPLSCLWQNVIMLSYCFRNGWIIHVIFQLIFNHDFKWSFVQCGFLWTCSHGLSHQFTFFSKKRLSFQLSLGAIARFLLRCAWRFSRDVSNQCRCHGLLSKFQYLDACSWGQQRMEGMEGQRHVPFMAGQPLVSLNKALLDPYFWGGDTLGGGLGWLAINSELVGMGAIENTLKSWFARIPWTKMLPIYTQFVHFCSIVLLVYFTSTVHRYWKLSFLLNLEILLPRMYKCHLSQLLQTADSCGVSSWGVFRGVSTEIFRSGGIFTFQVGPLGGGWWNKGHSKQVRWRRWIQEGCPLFFLMEYFGPKHEWMTHENKMDSKNPNISKKDMCMFFWNL